MKNFNVKKVSKVWQSPEHRSPRGVQSFVCEEAVSCRHPRSVKPHQTVKLFERHAQRPLGGAPHQHRQTQQPWAPRKINNVFQIYIIDDTEQWGHTWRLTSSWKAWSMAERLWSKRDLNFIFSTSLNVSNTTAKSWTGTEKMMWSTKYVKRDTLEVGKRRLIVPGSWWSRALWRGKQWRKHRTSGSWSTPASSHLGNYKKEERMRKLHTCGETQTLAMSSESRKHCWHVVCCDN